jgi:hypothetical protein
MADYIVGSGSLEHRCQCCGEIAEGVFCDDCLAHMAAEAEPGHEDARAPEPGGAHRSAGEQLPSPTRPADV